MKIQAIFCDEGVINPMQTAGQAHNNIYEVNKKTIANRSNSSLNTYDKQLVVIPWDSVRQKESDVVASFFSAHINEYHHKIERFSLTREADDNSLSYLVKVVNRVAAKYISDEIEIDVYVNGELQDIEEYLRDQNIPANITLNIHMVEKGLITTKSERIEGSDLVNEDKYSIADSPFQAELDGMKISLNQSNEPFVKKTLLKLAAILLEKGNENHPALVGENKQKNVFTQEDEVQQKSLLKKYYQAIINIVNQYETQALTPLMQDAIKGVLTQALAIGGTVSPKSKGAAFFSEYSYCSVGDLELTTTLLNNVDDALKNPDSDNIQTMLSTMEQLNTRSKAPYLLAAAVVLAGLLMVTGPAFGLLALGFAGIVSMSSGGFMAAMFAAVAISPFIGIGVFSVGMDGGAQQSRGDHLKEGLDTAIKSLESALNLEAANSPEYTAASENEDTLSEIESESEEYVSLIN